MKHIKRIIILLVVIALGYGVYRIFFACNKYSVDFKQNFTLEVFDQAKVNHEAYVKLIGIKDNRCKEENCIHEGQIEYTLVVVNNMRMQFVTLKTLETQNVTIKKTDYVLELIEGIDEKKATFRLNYVGKEEK